jgi:hypothetical protein
MISTGRGGGGTLLLGEEKEKRDQNRDQGPVTRIARAGDWTVVIRASHLRLLLLCAASGK